MDGLLNSSETAKLTSTLGERVTYSRDAVLTDEELAGALRISVEKLLKADIPHVMFGRDRRYLYGQVLDFLAERARSAA